MFESVSGGPAIADVPGSMGRLIAFPPFQVDAANEQLWRDGEAVPLRPKSFALLRYLAERPGQLVTKDELLDALWPRTHVTDDGWSAEFRIPLRVLRFPSLPVQAWDFQANRYISAKQESDDWAYFSRTLGGEVSHYGKLDGLEGLHERTPLELRPFLVGRVRRRDPRSEERV